MSVRVQVILEEEDAARFKSQAAKESKSLSGWLRDAGRTMLEISRTSKQLTEPDALKRFFQQCRESEKGVEPDWEDHKRLILETYQADNKP